VFSLISIEGGDEQEDETMNHVWRWLTSVKGHITVPVVLAVAVAAFGGGLARASNSAQTNLVSDVPTLAVHTDPVLKNAWGLSHGPNTPFWVSDADTNVSTLYDGTGAQVPLVVHIPGPALLPFVAVPTGNLFNATAGFAVSNGTTSGPSRFIFATATGTISGWNPVVDGTHAIRMVDNFPQASYTGIAMGSTSSGTFLYAANFGQRRIDVFNSNFAPTSLMGSFSDPAIPAGFAPFNIENIGGMLFVTYALVGPDGRDMAGPGNGFVDAFSTDGMLVARVASHGSLNSPWGMAIAPPTFDSFAGDLLVGNFGDGRINAFRLSDGKFRGQLKMQGRTIVIPGLWALVTGVGARNADPNAVYFTAGINHEADGLFGSLSEVVDEGD
jgi:uncharacterized protein (TIGR03118 family)